MVELAAHFASARELRAQKRFLATHALSDIRPPDAFERGYEDRGWLRLRDALPEAVRSRPCDRVYLGSEFCPQLALPERELGAGLALLRSRGFQATIVLAPVPQTRFASTRAMLRKFGRRGALEVAANDWGALAALDGWGHIPVLGRLLFRMKRLPRVSQETRPVCSGPHCRIRLAAQMREFSRFPTDAPWFADLLRGLNVRRMDTEMLPQGVSLRRPAPVKLSLFLPWAQVTGGGRCPVAGEDRRGGRCAFGCRQSYILPRYPGKTWPMLQLGHTVFAWMAARMEVYLRQGIYDRYILEPRLPM